MYELEEEFLTKLAKAYVDYNAEHIKDFLSDNVTYDSIWVIEQITNKADYIDYLEHKLEAMKNSGKVCIIEKKVVPLCPNCVTIQQN